MKKRTLPILSFLLLALSGPLLPRLYAQSENLSLRADPEYFSPNKDGLQDQIFIYPVLKTRLDAIRWRLDIARVGHGSVARMTGAGFPALVNWNGLDKKSAIVPDGEYQATFIVWGEKQKLSATTRFVVDTKPPTAQISLSTPVFSEASVGGDGITFIPAATDESSLDRWQLQILDSAGRTVQVFWSTGTVRPIRWDGSDRQTGVLVPQGTYRSVFEVWDKAGNSSAPIFADIKVAVTAREMLAKAIPDLVVNETDLGLVVQFDVNELFSLKNKKAEMKPEADPLLRELAILINAYPDVQVEIEGYSNINKKASLDRDRASLYAWSVYSNLVKKGHVQPSRLSVRGRGRSAMFDRRGIAVPVLKNGVEVRLAGKREW